MNGEVVYDPVFMSVQSTRGLMHWQVDRNAADTQKRLDVHGLIATGIALCRRVKEQMRVPCRGMLHDDYLRVHASRKCQITHAACYINGNGSMVDARFSTFCMPDEQHGPCSVLNTLRRCTATCCVLHSVYLHAT